MSPAVEPPPDLAPAPSLPAGDAPRRATRHAPTGTPHRPRPGAADDLLPTPERKAGRVRGMFAEIAGSYDLMNRLHSVAIDVWWRRQAVRAADVPAGGRVLDLCCGTGDLTLAFATLAPQAAEVVGGDFCHEMLVIGRRKAAGDRGGAAPVRFVEADALHLPFADARFDVVSIAFGLRNTADPDAALRECARVLRPGGRLVVLEFTLPRNGLVRRLYEFYFRTVMPLTATILSGDRSGAYRYLPESVVAWDPPEKLAARFTAAGFDGVRHTPLTFGIAALHVGVRVDGREVRA